MPHGTWDVRLASVRLSFEPRRLDRERARERDGAKHKHTRRHSVDAARSEFLQRMPHPMDTVVIMMTQS